MHKESYSEVSGVCLGSDCSGARSSSCTLIILSTTVFFLVYVSFSSLDFATFALFNFGFSAAIATLICNVAACLPAPTSGYLSGQCW